MTTVEINLGTNNTVAPIDGDTLLVYLIDRSGSMVNCWSATMEGLDADITTQKAKDDGKTEVMIVAFDSDYDRTDKTPFMGSIPVNESMYVGSLTNTPAFSSGSLGPRGGTPLYWSVGKLIDEVEKRVRATDGPVSVLFTIFTDGGDNHRVPGYEPERVKVLVESKQGDGWTFTYFGANQNAWQVGATFGVAAGNTMSYSTANMGAVMRSASAARTSYVGNAKSSMHASGMAYATETFFADAGQDEDTYKG